MYCLSLLMLLQDFRGSAVHNKKTHNGKAVPLVHHCLFYMDPQSVPSRLDVHPLSHFVLSAVYVRAVALENSFLFF